MKRKSAIILSALIAVLAIGLVQPYAFPGKELSASFTSSSSDFDKHGGYIDKVVFSVIEGMDAQLLALKTKEIDVVGDMVEPELLPTLIGEENIQINHTDRAGFGHISLNCELFPTNITAFRKAMAQALDKERISSDIWAGNALPADLPVPPIMEEWSIEDELPYHYYEKDIAGANATLEAAGFVDTDGDGWREWDPDGDGVGADLDGDGVYNDDVTINIPAAQESTIATRVAQLAAENLRETGIKATAEPTDFNSMLSDYMAGTGNAAFFGWSIGRDPDHLYDFFRTGQAYNELLYRFSNATYDMHADAMMTAPTKEEAIEHAKKCQEILFEEQPIIVCYQNLIYSAYRTDKFEGFVNAKGAGVPGGGATGYAWTPWKVRLKTGELGGTLRISLPETPDTLNVLSTDSAYSFYILDLIYDGLYTVNPYTWEDMPWISANWTLETVFDSALNQTVLKITHHLVQNATFHDGTPVTADDVVFSYWLINWTQAPYMIDGLKYWINTTKIDDYTVVVYSKNPAYFEFHRVGSVPILPKHVWKNPATYGKTSWDEVTPDDVLHLEPTVDQLVGSGVFKIKEIVPGEYYVLETNTQHPYSVRAVPPGLNLGVASSISAQINEEIEYTITVQNTGTKTLTNIEVKVTLPEGIDLASGSLTASIASLAPGESQDVTLVLRPVEEGTYTVNVEGTADYITPVSASTSITATPPPPRTPWELIIAGAAIAVLLIVVIYLVAKKK